MQRKRSNLIVNLEKTSSKKKQYLSIQTLLHGLKILIIAIMSRCITTIFGTMHITTILLLVFLGNKLKLLLTGERCIKTNTKDQERKMDRTLRLLDYQAKRSGSMRLEAV